MSRGSGSNHPHQSGTPSQLAQALTLRERPRYTRPSSRRWSPRLRSGPKGSSTPILVVRARLYTVPHDCAALAVLVAVLIGLPGTLGSRLLQTDSANTGDTLRNCCAATILTTRPNWRASPTSSKSRPSLGRGDAYNSRPTRAGALLRRTRVRTITAPLKSAPLNLATDTHRLHQPFEGEITDQLGYDHGDPNQPSWSSAIPRGQTTFARGSVGASRCRAARSGNRSFTTATITLTPAARCPHHIGAARNSKPVEGNSAEMFRGLRP